MISVVCVYNDYDLLHRSLLASLEGQVAHQLVLVDNTAAVFKSAAAALNHGAEQATGKYIMFVHQDVELAGFGWLQGVERSLDALPRLGIAGVIGVTVERGKRQKRLRGFVWGGGDIGHPLLAPEEVQTLDEIVLIVPRVVFRGFDEKTFDGWHCYGADYCLSTIREGLRVYAIPGYVLHGRKVKVLAGEEGVRQLWKTMKGVRFYLKRLYQKHGDYFERICTTTNGTGKYGVPLVMLWNERVFSLGFRFWRFLQTRRAA